MALSIPVRLANGTGNPPDAANWNDDYDWLTSLAFGTALIANGGQEKWTAGTTFTNPANATTLTDGWTSIKTGTSLCTADVTRESTIIDSGQYSMKVNITAAGSSDSYWAIKQSAGTPIAFGSATLVAGVRVRCATANKVRIKIFDGTTTTYSSYHTGDGTFQSLQAKATVAAVPTAITTTIEINPANFTDAIYIDSVFLYAVPSLISTRATTALAYSPFADAAAYLLLSGGTLSGALNLGSNKITSLANGTAATDAAAFGQLKLFQTVSSATATNTSTTGTTFTVTAQTITITPTSSAHNILIIAMGNSMDNATAGQSSYLTLARNGSNLGDINNGMGSIQGGTTNLSPISLTYLDSPATTSAVTYTTQIKSTSGGTARSNIAGNTQIMIAMEVG